VASNLRTLLQALVLLSGLDMAAADKTDEDRRMLARLQNVRLEKANVKDGRFDSAGADVAYRAAFRAHGIDVDMLTVDQAAARIRQSSLRGALAVALDDWASVCPDGKGKEHLLAIARRADPDPWRNRLRDAVQKGDARLLKQLVGDADLGNQHPVTVVLLADALVRAGNATEAVAVLRQAQRRHPDDFWINHQLASSLAELRQPQWQEAVRFYTAAVALRPQNPGVLLNLGSALQKNGQLEEALASFRQAVRLRPDYPEAYLNLGCLLVLQAKLDEAVAVFRKAIQLKPNYAEAHRNLGDALQTRGELDEAIAAYRAAIRLDPKNARAHLQLGNALREKGRLDEAIAEYQVAIRLDPQLLGALSQLGHALAAKGLLDEAIAAYDDALGRDPPDHHSVEARIGLGKVLEKKGNFKAAFSAYRNILAVDPQNAEIRFAFARTERLARLATLEGKLPAFLKGEFRPRNNDELLGLAEWCRVKKHHGAAAQLYVDAFAAEPKLADDLKSCSRYQAAGVAALAGTGNGEEGTRLDEKERARWRRQAVAWLRADLAQWAKQWESGKPEDRTIIPPTLRYWQRDPALVGVRDAHALAKLPAEEQEACRQLWAEVAALQKKATEEK
jgi:tetratricopeptide (TPR) repeat protein